MATYFFDIDGTLTYESTNELLPNAERVLSELVNHGHQVVITTARPRFGSAALIKQIAKITGETGQCSVLFGVSSPRVVINNEGVYAVKRKTDKAWTVEDCNDLLQLGK